MYDRTGWPAGLLQDDDRKLSRWFAGRPGARRQVDELQNLPELAPEGSPTASPRLRPVHGQDGSEHDAGAFVRPAQGSTGGDGGGAEGVAVEARQGHLYSWRGNDVIAMESGPLPRVSYIDPTWSWCSPPFHVDAKELSAQPMVYFHGEVPK